MSWGNKFVIIEWSPFDAPSSTHGVFTSFSLSRYCCLHFCRNKFGLILAQGYFTGQRSSIIHKLQLFMTLCDHGDMQLLSGNYSICAIKYPWCLYFFSLSKCCCLHYCRNKFRLLLVRGYLRVKGQGFIRNCNFLWLCVICNHRVVTTRCAIKYPWCFYFF